MKTLNFIFISFIMLLLYSSCNDSSSPSSIAKAYTKAVMNLDFEDAATYVTDDVRSTYEKMGLTVNGADNHVISCVRAVLQDAEFEVVQEEIEGNSVKITIAAKQKASSFQNHHVTLIKEGDVWKVNQDAKLIIYEIGFIKKGGLFLNEITPK